MPTCRLCLYSLTFRTDLSSIRNICFFCCCFFLQKRKTPKITHLSHLVDHARLIRMLCHLKKMSQPQPAMSESISYYFQLIYLSDTFQFPAIAEISEVNSNCFPVFTGLRWLTSEKNKGSILSSVLFQAVILNDDVLVLTLEPGFCLLKGVFSLPPLHVPGLRLCVSGKRRETMMTLKKLHK